MQPKRVIVVLWLAWALIVIAFQALVTARLVPKYPDQAQDWTTRFTERGYQRGHVYLLEPFMNNLVAWDSVYYLSIALGGYDDPRSPHYTPESIPPTGDRADPILSQNYAFSRFIPF